MGLNVFILITGFGVGTFVFGALLPFGLTTDLAVFAVGELLLSAAESWLFRGERPMLASPTRT